MRAYTWLRNEKEKMFDQNKEWNRFRSVFRGLHRVHERAKRPNKITEYDMPVNNQVKIKEYKPNQQISGASIEFDPCAMLDAEFAEDEKKEKDLIQQIYDNHQKALQ